MSKVKLPQVVGKGGEANDEPAQTNIVVMKGNEHPEEREAKYDPQAAMVGWFLEHGWLPPEEVKIRDAECQARVEEIFKVLKKECPEVLDKLLLMGYTH